MEEAKKEENQQVSKILETLKRASHDLKSKPNASPNEKNSSATKALSELENEADAILSSDPHLSTLSQHLTNLKTLIETLQTSRGYGLKSYLRRRYSTHELVRVAELIEAEIQGLIDLDQIEALIKALRTPHNNEEECVRLLIEFQNRLSQGFNRDLQDLILKSKLFTELETSLCDPNRSKIIREQSGIAIGALIRFNKDVFVGEVLMGMTIRALISMGSTASLSVLCSLIKLIKSPLVDEIQSNGQIPKIISFLSSEELQIRVLAMDCVLEIGYFGRKEAIEAMLAEGLIEKLVELQRSELGGDLIEMGRAGGLNKRVRESEEKMFLESHPFASCVARFAVQLEVGEGLRQRERRSLKQEILGRLKAVCVSDAEAATIMAEVLWGSSP